MRLHRKNPILFFLSKRGKKKLLYVSYADRWTRIKLAWKWHVSKRVVSFLFKRDSQIEDMMSFANCRTMANQETDCS